MSGALRRVQPHHGLCTCLLILRMPAAAGQPPLLPTYTHSRLNPSPLLSARSPPCAQVVVLVTEDLKVICLNHNLQKEWEEDLAVSGCPCVCYNCVRFCWLQCAVRWRLGAQNVGQQRVSCRRSQTAY